MPGTDEEARLNALRGLEELRAMEQAEAEAAQMHAEAEAAEQKRIALRSSLASLSAETLVLGQCDDTFQDTAPDVSAPVPPALQDRYRSYLDEFPTLVERYGKDMALRVQMEREAAVMQMLTGNAAAATNAKAPPAAPAAPKGKPKAKPKAKQTAKVSTAKENDSAKANGARKRQTTSEAPKGGKGQEAAPDSAAAKNNAVHDLVTPPPTKPSAPPAPSPLTEDSAERAPKGTPSSVSSSTPGSSSLHRQCTSKSLGALLNRASSVEDLVSLDPDELAKALGDPAEKKEAEEKTEGEKKPRDKDKHNRRMRFYRSLKSPALRDVLPYKMNFQYLDLSSRFF